MHTSCWGCIQVVGSGSGRGRARVVDSVGTYVAESVSLATLEEGEGGGDQKRMNHAPGTMASMNRRASECVACARCRMSEGGTINNKGTLDASA